MNIPQIVFVIAVSAVLGMITWIDLKKQLLPMNLIWISCFVFLIWQSCLFPDRTFSLIEGGLVGGGWMMVKYLISRGKWVGVGDIGLGCLIGVVVGWPSIVYSFYFTYLLGGLLAIWLIVFRGKERKTRIAFAPLLIAGALIARIFY